MKKSKAYEDAFEATILLHDDSLTEADRDRIGDELMALWQDDLTQEEKEELNGLSGDLHVFAQDPSCNHYTSPVCTKLKFLEALQDGDLKKAFSQIRYASDVSVAEKGSRLRQLWKQVLPPHLYKKIATYPK